MDDVKIEYNKDVTQLLSARKRTKWMRIIEEFASDANKENCMLTFENADKAKAAYTGLRWAVKKFSLIDTIKMAQRQEYLILWKVKHEG